MEFNYNNEQNMHSILDEGFNAMRRSFDRSMSSSKPSPAPRKKSQLRKVLDELKSNHSSIGAYSEEISQKYNDHSHNMGMYQGHQLSSNISSESPLK